jgi:hypothetical protein
MYAQGESDSNGRIELVKTTRDSQVLGSFSDGRSRAFSIASKDSKLTDQNSYKVRACSFALYHLLCFDFKMKIAKNWYCKFKFKDEFPLLSCFRNQSLCLFWQRRIPYLSVYGTTK